MTPLSHILVPVDFSDQSRGMLRYAKLIAERYNAEVTLLHALSSPGAIPAPDPASFKLLPAPRDVMAETTAQLATFGDYELRGVTVRRLVSVGDPVEQIAGFVRTEGVKLIAMPTHGLGGLRRLLIGSVTAKVLHDVPCPVLTGVHLEQPPHHLPLAFSNVACAVDLDCHSHETLTWAAQFASDFHAQLNLVHAIPALEPGFEIPFGGDWKSDLANLARSDLEKLVAATGSDVSGIYIEAGEPRKAVCSFAKSSGADLLIIGRGSHEGIPANLPTEAYAIIRESPCPVISV